MEGVRRGVLEGASVEDQPRSRGTWHLWEPTGDAGQNLG